MSLASLPKHRWVRPAVRALAGLIVLWLAMWLAIPPLVKGPLQRIASEELGRKVTIEAIDFEPWSLELALHDVVVAGARGGPPQLTIRRIYADGELQSLLRLAPVVDALKIEDPVLRLIHLGGGRYDVDDIIVKLTAPDRARKPDAGPVRLALYNLALTGGSIDFTDKTVGAPTAAQQVREVTLQVPFISTLPSQREVKIEPHLAFTLNGSRFDSSARGTPFAQTGKADAQLRLKGLNLQPYLAYLPPELPIKVQSATVDADVTLAFEQRPRMAVKLSGIVQANGVRIADRQGADLLSYERLEIDMADVRPLERVVRLRRMELTAPVVTATRDAAGRINLAQLGRPSSPPAEDQPAAAEAAASVPETAASAASASAARIFANKANTRSSSAAPPGWVLEVATAAVRGGTLRWADQTTRPAVALQATDVVLDVANIATPFARPSTFKGRLSLQGGTVSFAGEATGQKARVDATVNALALEVAAPYLAQTLEPVVTGQLTGDVGVLWQARAPLAPQAGPTAPAAHTGATGITVKAGPLALEQLIVKQDKNILASLGKLDIAGAEVLLDERTATLERMALSQPQLALERGADGRWMFERWLKTAPAAQGGTTAAANAAPAHDHAAPWKLRIADFSLRGGTVTLADNAQPRPVALEVSDLGITARNLATDGGKPEAIQLTARAAAPGKGGTKAAPGKLDYQGTLALQPLATQGQLQATRLPLHALNGYLARQLAVELLRADVGYRGQVAVSQTDKGLSLRLAGDAEIEELKANSTAASTPKTEAQVGAELLAWKSLNLRGLSVSTAPGAAPRVEVRETSLVDFFARITINEAGRINLGDIVKAPAEARAANAASTSAGTPGLPAPATTQTAAASAASSAQAAVAPANPRAPVVVSGPVSLVNGKVLFSDFFIQPNYSADLSELTGKLGAFSSEAPLGEPVLADLELRGRAEGSASLEVTGKLNPLAKPLALDIMGTVRDLELPPLTPYAVKYAGHGIERGKLSMDVKYKVLPNGQLTASNRLVLNQLTFGDPVEGAPNSLPVKLAAALLADRQGVIDLDLPINGSLNDPQFRIGPVISKIIVGLIGKALTSPFSLLARALGGGGEEMSNVPFAPGSATLTPEAQQTLDKVAKALADRPALKITVTGMASLQDEREGLQRERLQQLVLAEKQRIDPTDTAPASAAEYPALLKEVYRRADIPKPRNLIGLAKDLAVPEMEALLMAHQPVTDAMAAELATQRSQAVRDYLAAQKLPAGRLFVAAPKTGKQPDKWTPRAELSLRMQ